MSAEEQVAVSDKINKIVALLAAEDAVSGLLGIKREVVGLGYSRLSMVVREDMANGHGTCHGGMTFSLADAAFGYACNTHNKLTFGAACSIDYVNPAFRGDVLTAECKEVFLQGRSGVYDVVVKNQDGLVIVLFRGNSRSRNELLVSEE
ncbi:phenylacetic acid degradation protein PaaD [Cycloclasticus sp. 46_120_T64]|nr:phenylacetic acid degradation protein PaaD [Cycloclasticus sp. 46_120_T64]